MSNFMICMQSQAISPGTRAVTAAQETQCPPASFHPTIQSHLSSEDTKHVIRNSKRIIYCLSYEGMQFCRDPTAMVAGPQGPCLSCTCALWVRPPCSTWVASVLSSGAGTTLGLLPLALECFCITQMPAFLFSTCCDAEVVGKHSSGHT